MTHINIAIELPSVIKFLLLIKGAGGSVSPAVGETQRPQGPETDRAGRAPRREHAAFRALLCLQARSWALFCSFLVVGSSLFYLSSKNYVLTWLSDILPFCSLKWKPTLKRNWLEEFLISETQLGPDENRAPTFIRVQSRVFSPEKEHPESPLSVLYSC